MKIRALLLGLIVSLFALPSYSQTCPQPFTLRQETCPSGVTCSTKGSLLTYRELDRNMINAAYMCSQLDDLTPDTRTITCTTPLLCNGGSSMTLESNRTLSINHATFTTPGISTPRVVYVDAKNADGTAQFGSLGTADDGPTIQAAIDYAAGLTGKATVIMPAGEFFVGSGRVKMKAFVDFRGQGMATKLTANFGLTGGGLIQLATSSVERMTLSDLYLNVRGVGISCVDYDNSGGTFTTTASPELRIENIYCSIPGIDGFRLKSRNIAVINSQVFDAVQDGFALLDGTSGMSTSDSHFIGNWSDASRRYGVYSEGVNNTHNGWKIGESDDGGLVIASGSNNNVFAGIVIDNTGYPSPFDVGTPLLVQGNDNVITGLIVTRGVGQAVIINPGAFRNRVSGVVSPIAGGGTLTYGAYVNSTGGNNVELTVNLSDSPLMIGAIDPASDLVNNRIIANGITYDSRDANTFLAGPTTGADATSTFRAMVAADLPASYTAPLATALASNGSNCSAGAGAGGVNASGVAEDCTTYAQISTDLGNTGAAPHVIATHLSSPLPVAQGGTNLTTATDDNTMVGNGTTWQSKSIPDCADTNGNHLNYTASSNTFSCGTSSPLTLGASTYTPTITSVTNIATTASPAGQWLRVGNVMTVSGVVSIDPTAGTTLSTYRISLPVASNLSNLSQCIGGIVFMPSGTTVNGRIIGDTTNDAAQVDFISDSGAASQIHAFHFTCLVQ